MAFDYLSTMHTTGGGGGRLASALTQLMQNHADQQDQISNAGKAADYARKAMGDQAPQLTGVTDDEWGNLGNRDKAAAMQGLQQKQTLSQLLTQQRMNNSRADAAEAENTQQAQAVAADQRFSGMYQDKIPTQQSILSMFSGAGPVRNQTSTPQDILSMAMQSGMAPDRASNLAQNITQAVTPATYAGRTGATAAQNFFSSDPDKMAQDVPGFPGLKRVITGPKTSILRDANGNVAQPMTDEDGNPIGYGVPSGTGTQKFVPLSQTTPKGGVTDQDKFKAGATAHAARVKEAATNLQMLTPGTKEYTAGTQAYQQALDDQDGFLSGKSERVPAAGKVATAAVAQSYLQKFGGDKAKARAAAKADGYSF